jgi:protein TonB
MSTVNTAKALLAVMAAALLLGACTTPTSSVPPEFPGGKMGWEQYLKKNLHSDVAANQDAPAGRYSVMVSFLIDKAGRVNSVIATNDPGYGTAEEAVRVIQRSPVWQPGTNNGHPTVSRQVQPVTFMVVD